LNNRVNKPDEPFLNESVAKPTEPKFGESVTKPNLPTKKETPFADIVFSDEKADAETRTDFTPQSTP